jgi:hypothetical protein
MDKLLDQRVRQRAGFVCEYCHLPESLARFRFVLDHIIARQHGGETIEENLALCCGRCNLNKGPNLSGFDPATRRVVDLFNPRTDAWLEHFEWDGPIVRGLTPTGRATVVVLKINEADRVVFRRAAINEGKFPG